MGFNRELMKGSTVTLVLTVLAQKEMYGYELIREIEERSVGAFQLGEGTLYPILHTLEKDGWVEARWEGEEGARRRRYYRITSEGRVALKDKRNEWASFRAAVDRVLAGAKAGVPA